MVEPINFLGAIRNRWRLIVVLAVIGAIASLLFPTSNTTNPKTILKWKTYAIVGAPASSGLISGTVSAAQIEFYGNTFPVKLAAVSDVGLKGNPYLFAGSMEATTVAPGAKASSASTKKGSANGNVTLYASAQTPSLAADLANAYAQELGNTLEAVAAARQTSTSGSGKNASSNTSSPTTGFQVIFPGTPQSAKRINLPSSSTLNSKKVRLLLGIVVGALIAIAYILIREVLNKTIRRPGRAALHFKMPVVSEIPETYPPAPGIVDVVERPTSPAAESYRKLRMSVRFEPLAPVAAAASSGDSLAELFGAPSGPIEPYVVPAAGSRSVMLVTSTIAEPTRPKVVANLAATFAEAGERVIVIGTSDLDSGGTTTTDDVILGDVTPEDVERALVPVTPDGVFTLSFSRFMTNSGQLVNRAPLVLEAARQVSDAVLIETPGFLTYHHAEALLHAVDVVLVVCENGATEVPDAQDMGDVLRRLGAPTLGVVFTGVELSESVRKALGGAKPVSVRSRSLRRSEERDEAGTDGAEAGTDEAGIDEAVEVDVKPDTAHEMHPS